MKKISFILLALVLCTGFAAAQDDAKKPKAFFPKTIHEFGKVAESAGTVSCEFPFTNEGDAPLIITRVQASCGCTTPDYTKEPILPGKTGVIKVNYSTTGRPGAFDKKVTVFTNVPDAVDQLTIKGEVTR